MQERDEQQRAVGMAQKRGAVFAGIALVAVLALAFVSYGAFSSGAETTSSTGQSSEASLRAVSAGSASSTGAGADSSARSEFASDSSSSSNGETDGRGPSLFDYDVTVYDEYGDARTLVQLADGKPFVMNFWATWCPYCVQEMSDYQQIYDEYEGRVSFAFIDIADGKRETVEDGSSWLLENEYTLPAYYDTTLEAMYAYSATNLPTTVIVSADGEIMDISAGAINPDLMRTALDSLLEA